MAMMAMMMQHTHTPARVQRAAPHPAPLPGRDVRQVAQRVGVVTRLLVVGVGITVVVVIQTAVQR